MIKLKEIKIIALLKPYLFADYIDESLRADNEVSIIMMVNMSEISPRLKYFVSYKSTIR